MNNKFLAALVACAIVTSPVNAAQSPSEAQEKGSCSKPYSCSCEKTCFKEDICVQGSVNTNTIGPVYSDGCGNCFPDPRPGAVTCFTGNAAIKPTCDITLLTNNIDPVKFEDDMCLIDSEGTTTFGGSTVFDGEACFNDSVTFNDPIAVCDAANFKEDVTFQEDVTFNDPVVFNDNVTFNAGSPPCSGVFAGNSHYIGGGNIGGISNSGRAVLRVNFSGSGNKNAYVRITITGKYNDSVKGIYTGEFLITNDENSSPLSQHNLINDGSTRKIIFDKVTTATNSATIHLEDAGFGAFSGGRLIFEVSGQVTSVVIL